MDPLIIADEEVAEVVAVAAVDLVVDQAGLEEVEDEEEGKAVVAVGEGTVRIVIAAVSIMPI